MREITESQLRYISGAGGAPATSANAAGAAAIVGALAGIPGGPLGVVVGAVSAGLTTAIGSTVGSGSAVLLLVAVANYIFIYFTGTFSVVPVKHILFV